MDRVFLDANVLYSAVYLESSGLARLVTLEDAQLLTSGYAIEEARRKLALDRPKALLRLQRLLSVAATVDAPQNAKLPPNVRLDWKDEPILLAAIHARADYLLTGDARHFAHLYGKRGIGDLTPNPFP